LSSGVGRISSGGTVLLGFWARGLGYPYGILELGSVLVGRVDTRFWAELVCGFKLGKATAGRSTRQVENEGLASDPGMLIYIFVL